MKKLLLLTALSCLFYVVRAQKTVAHGTESVQTYYVQVQIQNSEVINALGKNILTIEVIDYAANAPRVGSTIVVTGHLIDGYWETIWGLLEKEFSYIDYRPYAAIGGPGIISFQPEKKFFLNALVIKYVEY